MKEFIKKKAEMFVYGILSLMFGAAFFFGVLYPSHSMSPAAYKVYSYTRQQEDEMDWKDIRCRFYIYERLKNS